MTKAKKTSWDISRSYNEKLRFRLERINGLLKSLDDLKLPEKDTFAYQKALSLAYWMLDDEEEFQDFIRKVRQEAIRETIEAVKLKKIRPRLGTVTNHQDIVDFGHDLAVSDLEVKIAELKKKEGING